MSFLPPPKGCHPGYNGCGCQCHRVPGIMHVMACCRPTDKEKELEVMIAALPERKP